MHNPRPENLWVPETPSELSTGAEARSVSDPDGGLHHLARVLRTVAQAIGSALMIVLATWVIVALFLALVHVMNFWASPGLP